MARVAPGLALAVLVATGCEEAAPADGACGGEACELAQSRDELIAELDGLGDPVAEYFRAAAGAGGTVGADFEEIIAGIGGVLGCDAETRSTFVVLSNLGLAPKAVVTHCTDDPQSASQVFTIFEPGPDGTDLDGEHFRLAAWDESAGAYRRYQMAAHPDGGLGVVAQPEFCLGCHGGTKAVLGWSPIMNEMTNPWAQWNASPGFESFLFEDPRAREVSGPTFDALTQRLDSASNLEPVVRGGIDRYVAAWVGQREAAPDLDAAAELLRPVFCDETFNYVSEVHQSGELLTSAVLDAGIRRQFTAIDPAGWPWAWVWDDTLRVTPPPPGEAPLALIAVRGELAVQAELALVSREVLSPRDILRVRALDWTRPIGSELRCEAFERGLQQASEAMDVAALSDVDAVVKALYAEAMAPWAVPDGADVLAVADASEPEAAAALASGDLGRFGATLMQWGDAIEAHVDQRQSPEGREALEAERVERGCLARRRYTIAPLIPGTDACP